MIDSRNNIKLLQVLLLETSLLRERYRYQHRYHRVWWKVQ